jgi:tyrosine-protein kinase Etk/Wzc
MDQVNLLQTKGLKMLRYLPLYLICMMMSLTIIYLFRLYEKPLYIVSASILIPEENLKLSSGNFKDDASINFDSLVKDITVSKIKSALPMVVSELHLNVAYKKKGKLIDADLYKNGPIKFQLTRIGSTTSNQLAVTLKGSDTYLLKTDSETEEFKFNSQYTRDFGSWIISKTPDFVSHIGSTILVEIQDVDEVNKALLKTINFQKAGKDDDLFELSVRDGILQRGKDILFALQLEINKVAKQENEAKAISERKLIKGRLTALSDQFDTLQEEVNSITPTEHALMISSKSARNLMIMRQNDQLLNEVNFQLEAIDGLAKYIQNNDLRISPPPSTSGIFHPTLEALFQQVLMIQSEYQQLSASHLKTDPIFDSIEDQSANLRTAIKRFVKDTKATLSKKRSLIQSSNIRIEAFVNQLPDQERKLVRLKRKQNANENLYAFLAKKSETAALNHISGNEYSRIVKSKYEVENKAKGFYAWAVSIGLLLPTLLTGIHRIIKQSNQQPTLTK